MLPEFRDIEKAARRIEGFAVRTPVLESPKLNALTGGRILIKAECLQRTGSFKFRGAWNMISKLDAKKARGGVVAYSSGNHAQGVAAAAQIKGLPALIVMPADTPAIKQENTRSYGAEVVTYDRATQSREAIAERCRAERHAMMAPPFEHADIIAGQGTVGLELASEANDRGIRLDGVLVCCSGGGLAAGVALAMEELQPGARVHSVEPAGFDDYARSLASGRIETNPKPSGSICDALMSPAPGEMTFAINRRLLGEGLAVTDAEAAEAVRFAFGVLKIVLEPGGAVALAAVLSGKIAARGKAIGVIASGGNCDPGLFAQILNREI
ncbi:threonine/serine dehydratase [Aestuariivirga sp.]|uniref:threonine ammonia-lyase n=1 Tax=Aestuariivirga sp. TaxID=2650926 RepID=UPI0025BBA94F|nr:threonine/serine dehydratase [Aestuariivirga sp.]